LLGGSLVRLAGLPSLLLDAQQLSLQFAPSGFQAAGNLRQQVVAIFDASPDVPRTVLEFPLTLKVKRVEQDLGDCFGVSLRDKPPG
jgi:hypothetical protein